jgi:hypothetical protein
MRLKQAHREVWPAYVGVRPDLDLRCSSAELEGVRTIESRPGVEQLPQRWRNCQSRKLSPPGNVLLH